MQNYNRNKFDDAKSHQEQIRNVQHNILRNDNSVSNYSILQYCILFLRNKFDSLLFFSEYKFDNIYFRNKFENLFQKMHNKNYTYFRIVNDRWKHFPIIADAD